MCSNRFERQHRVAGEYHGNVLANNERAVRFVLMLHKQHPLDESGMPSETFQAFS